MSRHAAPRYADGVTTHKSHQAPHFSSRRGTQDLLVYYCLCGEFVLVCNTALEDLPLRPLDHSHILRALDSAKADDGVRQHADIYKISASQGKGQMLQRPDGSLERQYDFRCTRCNLPIGYEHTPPPLKSGGTFTFILPGALTQGVAPPNALLETMR
ncbi:hypothetical protein MVES_000318 [Malassezia vespertilionis]|uniref:STEEP1 domain-containing protein n=1 Tax=Malassezia vespertilionis TaxID=2020962 RepID=A0A2N1JFJ4_9BASI|nr:hypothetical protein MVES_000318 [Malassezia vespertilionis]